MDSKQNNKRLLVILLMVLIIMISLLSTGCSAKSKLIGQWQDESGSKIEFTKDGSYTIYGGLLNFSGTYSLDKNVLKFNTASILGLSISTTLEIVRISSKMMELKD